MRLEPMSAPDALHRRDADARGSSHRRACPGTVRNLVCGAIVTPMEGAYGNQERHPGRFVGGA
jgi:hypothetical protein